jgi:hypothetical protein
MATIHELENTLYERWLSNYTKDEQECFCFDGLCYNGEIFNKGYNAKPGDEEKKWEQATRKVLFLMKDTNGNPGEDYRKWPWRTIRHPFFNTIFYWLEGLSETTKDTLFTYDDLSDDPAYIIDKYPLAIVNVKKMSGGSSVSNDSLCESAKRDGEFLKEQVASILKPNIVVCGGGSGTVLQIAEDIIYPNLKFEKINEWCYYCSTYDILLIDSYHPGARVSNQQKFDDMFLSFQKFLILKK